MMAHAELDLSRPPKLARTDSRPSVSFSGAGAGRAPESSVLIAAQAVPRLTDSRAAALRRGTVPCFNPALAAAFGEGVRSLDFVSEVEAAHEELRPEELCSLLAASGPLCNLGVRTLLALARAATAEGVGGGQATVALNAALAVGVLPLAFNVAATLAAELETESTSLLSPALSLMIAITDVITTICSPVIFPGERSIGISAVSQVRRLAAAATAMVRDAVYESALGSAIADAEASVAVKLINAFYFIELHPSTHGNITDDVYANEFASGAFLSALLRMLSSSPCTPLAAAFSKVLHYGVRRWGRMIAR